MSEFYRQIRFTNQKPDMHRVDSVMPFAASYRTATVREPVRESEPKKKVNPRKGKTQMNKLWIPLFIAIVGCLATAQRANAEAFKTNAECVPGKRVADKIGQNGKIIGPTRGDPVGCDVLWDSDGKSHYYIFWMLHLEGGSSETNDKLVSGTYECFAGGHYTFMDMRILGPNTYESAGERGKYHLEPSRKIVFETGPLVKATSKLLAGPAIGLNMDGGSFYATTCELKKH